MENSKKGEALTFHFHFLNSEITHLYVIRNINLTSLDFIIYKSKFFH